MKPPIAVCILVAVALALSPSELHSADRANQWSAGTGTVPTPPLGLTGLPSLSVPDTPTLIVVGPLPSLIYSTASDRFLLVLRRMNGQVVDTEHALARSTSILDAPVGEDLRLDVIPLDGTARPVFGIPVQADVAVVVVVGAR